MKFTRLQKICIPILVFLLLADVLLIQTLYQAFYVNPFGMTTTYKTLSSPYIPANMNHLSMVYVSDLEYGEFSTPEQAQSWFDKIYELDPDIFIFGGDLFWQDAQVSDELKAQMTAWLSAIDAPLGKYAVYGEQDLGSPERLELVNSIYHDAQIETLDNGSVLCANQSRQGIRIAGLSAQADFNAACGSMQAGQFNLLVSHYPDHLLSESLSLVPVSYALAGNAHGTQITWPFIGGYRQWPGSTELNRSDPKDLPFDYMLTSGLGCIDFHARLNATVEIVYYLLESQEEQLQN